MVARAALGGAIWRISRAKWLTADVAGPARVGIAAERPAVSEGGPRTVCGSLAAQSAFSGVELEAHQWTANDPIGVQVAAFRPDDAAAGEGRRQVPSVRPRWLTSV